MIATSRVRSPSDSHFGFALTLVDSKIEENEAHDARPAQVGRDYKNLTLDIMALNISTYSATPPTPD